MSALIPAWFLACGLISAVDGKDAVANPGPGTAAVPERKWQDVHNVVEGRNPIIFLKPQGTRVAKGELVCELEAFAIRERVKLQEKNVSEAEKSYQLARQAREEAENGVTEYVEGKSRLDALTLKSEISLDEMKLKAAEGKLNTSRRLYEQGKLARGWVTTDELAVQRARLALEKAQRKRDTLEKFTRDKTIKILRSKVERARAEELAREAVYTRERSARDHLLEQIEKCKIPAPLDGTITYARAIEEGAEVDKGQLLFRIEGDHGDEDGPRAEAKSATVQTRGLNTNRR